MALKQLTAPFPYFGLLNVKPGHPVDNLVNRGDAALMLLRDCGETQPVNITVCTYSADLFGVKLALRVPLPALVRAFQPRRLTAPMTGAAFLVHVGVVIGSGANAKVSRVATRWVVATMQKAHPVWYSSDKEFVC